MKNTIRQNLKIAQLQSKWSENRYCQKNHLGIYLDEHLSWNFQINQTKNKLSESSGLLAKLRYFFKVDLFRTVYFAVFDSLREIEKIQEKTRFLYFKWKYNPVNPLFKNLKIMRMRHVIFTSCLFVYNQINEGLPANFHTFFTTADNHILQGLQKTVLLLNQYLNLLHIRTHFRI